MLITDVMWMPMCVERACHGSLPVDDATVGLDALASWLVTYIQRHLCVVMATPTVDDVNVPADRKLLPGDVIVGEVLIVTFMLNADCRQVLSRRGRRRDVTAVV